MAERTRIYKHPTEHGWLVQKYGHTLAQHVLSHVYAVHIATTDEGWPALKLVERPAIKQDEDTCPECGRHLVTEERVYPGGAHYIVTCINESCKYEESYSV